MADNVIRIVIADDHLMFREGLKRLLHDEPGFRVIGEAGDGTTAIEITRRLRPDVLLLDLAMPGVPGLEALQALAELTCAVRTIVLTAGFDKDALVRALQLGARGILLKDAATRMLFKSIRCVMQDQYWLGRDNVADVVEALRQMTTLLAQSHRNRFRLTRRELEIVAAVVACESNKEIAQRLSVSDETIKHHLSNIFDKLGVFSRLELAVFAINHGLTQANRIAS